MPKFVHSLGRLCNPEKDGNQTFTKSTCFFFSPFNLLILCDCIVLSRWPDRWWKHYPDVKAGPRLQEDSWERRQSPPDKTGRQLRWSMCSDGMQRAALGEPVFKQPHKVSCSVLRPVVFRSVGVSVFITCRGSISVTGIFTFTIKKGELDICLIYLQNIDAFNFWKDL